MKHIVVFLIVMSSCQAYASDVLERALRSAFVPRVRLNYTFANGSSHLFWATLTWDVDDAPSLERQLEAVKIERLQREVERLRQGREYLAAKEIQTIR